MYIFDYYFAHQDFDLKRCLFGHLKHFNNSNEYQFTTDSYKKCFYFINIESHFNIPSYQLEHFKENFSKNPDNILIIDTTLEDFCCDNFVNLSRYIDTFINPSNILVLTSAVPIKKFKKLFNIHYKCINYHFMESTLKIWTEEQNDNIIKPQRQIFTKHFIAFMKNARPVRNIFHAFFTKNNLISKSFYSWHNLGLAETWKPGDSDELINVCLDLGLIDSANDIEKLKIPILFDNIMKRDEWLLPDISIEDGGIFCNFDTSHSMDTTFNIIYDERKHSAYFTEKTFIPMFYKIPSINLFSQTHFKKLKQLGYKPLDNLLFPMSNTTNKKEFLQNQFARILHLSNLSLSELHELCNSKKIKDALDHNYNLFLEQNEFKKIKETLKNLY